MHAVAEEGEEGEDASDSVNEMIKYRSVHLCSYQYTIAISIDGFCRNKTEV